MESYKHALAGLNARQRQAVEQIDGPVLVIAGPGTGKTQLISTRVGYILENTDTPADSILLLTFTEAGVQAMRDRLGRLIGAAAYDVQLSTYHAFGGEIFRRYPDYFEGLNLSLIEELGADSLLRGIIAKLPYTNPLKFADNYVGELKSFISEAKRALLSPTDIDEIAADNLKYIRGINRSARGALDKLALVSKKAVPAFEKLHDILGTGPFETLPGTIRPLGFYAQAELRAALEEFYQSSKTTPLAEWKKRWLAKDAEGRQILDGLRLNQRLEAAAGIYAKYDASLRKQQLYDYDDMILRAIAALETNRELRYSLAERYNYIMLDEFQDTNPAQFRLVQLLSDHPVHEGRPNVLAVGDDDQAIYAFQGAEQGNMLAFARHYKDVKIISLEDNYRSTKELIETGQNLANQIKGRLHYEFPDVTKTLVAANPDLPGPPKISLRNFRSDASQYQWIADEIAKLLKAGWPADQIAVLAPKHRYLAPLLPYLSRHNVPISYERRENILDEPLVLQLERMAQLALALADGNEVLANAIWPEVLSYDFWNMPTGRIWSLNWQARQSHEPLTAGLLNDEEYGYIASFFLRLAAVLPLTTLEQQLDGLIGLPGSQEDLKLPVASPFYEYYFSQTAAESSALQFTKLIGDLNVLRTELRYYRRGQSQPVGLRLFVEFIEGHRAANLNVLNSSPYHTAAAAVNLMTAYAAKGREFRAVFIIAALDEVWGSGSRNAGYRLGLPANLTHIRYQGASEDERLRLLFVAATRAVDRLYFTSYTQDLAGKVYAPLKYLQIEEGPDGSYRSAILPPKFASQLEDKNQQLAVEAAADYWQDRHLPPFDTDLDKLLEPVLNRYQLSATHLNQFLDIVNAGPLDFLMQSLLSFPSAPSLTAAFGTAIHNSLRSAGNIYLSEGSLPDQERLFEIFEAQLGRVELPSDELSNLTDRGRSSLKAWLAQIGPRLKKSDRFEYDFRSEGSAAGHAPITGLVDRLEVNEKTKRIIIHDYKTGQNYSRWQSGVIKLHKFRQQLIFYKLLVESSRRFRGYQVTHGFIDFVEPDEQGQINHLELVYDEAETKAAAELIGAVWERVHSLHFPDISAYPKTIAGIRQFEADLTKKNTVHN
jgi:DNA helicase-2/ATP-dependent DNA helicase PcrA